METCNYLSVLLCLVLTCLSTCVQVPDYYDIIKKPIALSTIREKVNNCEYQTAGEETDCRWAQVFVVEEDKSTWKEKRNKPLVHWERVAGDGSIVEPVKDKPTIVSQ